MTLFLHKFCKGASVSQRKMITSQQSSWRQKKAFFPSFYFLFQKGRTIIQRGDGAPAPLCLGGGPTPLASPATKGRDLFLCSASVSEFLPFSGPSSDMTVLVVWEGSAALGLSSRAQPHFSVPNPENWSSLPFK